MIKFILGIAFAWSVSAMWRWFTDSPPRKYYVKFGDTTYSPMRPPLTKYLDNGNQHTLPLSSSWPEEYKEEHCYFYGKEAAKEALCKANLKEEHQAKIIKGPKTKSPACKLKQRMYNWLKKEC